MLRTKVLAVDGFIASVTPLGAPSKMSEAFAELQDLLDRQACLECLVVVTSACFISVSKVYASVWKWVEMETMAERGTGELRTRTNVEHVDPTVAGANNINICSNICSGARRPHRPPRLEQRSAASANCSKPPKIAQTYSKSLKTTQTH